MYISCTGIIIYDGQFKSNGKKFYIPVLLFDAGTLLWNEENLISIDENKILYGLCLIFYVDISHFDFAWFILIDCH